MKSIFEFSLPDEENEFRMALNGSRYWSALWEFREEMRKLRKYHDKPTFEDAERSWLDVINGNEIDFDEIQ
jgi:hypothetical protein